MSNSCCLTSADFATSAIDRHSSAISINRCAPATADPTWRHRTLPHDSRPKRVTKRDLQLWRPPRLPALGSSPVALLRSFRFRAAPVLRRGRSWLWPASGIVDSVVGHLMNSEEKPSARETAEPEQSVDLPLTAYCTNWALRMPIVVAPRERAWMEATPQRYANRCLPLLIANQAGWLVLGAHKVAATWDGGLGLESLRVEHLAGDPPYSASS